MKRLRGLSSLFLAAALAAAPACGPKAATSPVGATLPGEAPAGASAGVAPGEPDPWAGRTDLIQAPAAAPPAPVKLPAVERFTLPNGLAVMIVENHDLPVISMDLAVRAGELDEQRDKRALATFTASMLTKGTKKRSADQLSEMVDSVGGILGASADDEASHVTCVVQAKDLKTCLTLMPEVVVTPTFPDKELGLVRDALLSELKQERDDAKALVGLHFANVLWGEDNVRGWPVTTASVGAVTRKDVVAWHAAYFKPNNSILAIAGDVDAKKLKADLGRAFGAWRKGTVPARAQYAEPTWQGPRVRLVDKPDQTQSHIVVGHLGLAHADPDYFATLLVNYSLGGGAFSSRLMKVVRSEGGKTYGAWSRFEAPATRGAFFAQTFTRNAETWATTKLLLEQIAKMQAEGPTAVELAAAQSNLSGNYPLHFQSASDVAASLLGAELHGLGEGYVRDFPVLVGNTKLEDAKAAAAKRLDPKNVVIVIVGKAADVAPQLDKAGIKFEKVDYLEPISKRDRDAKAAGPAKVVDPKAAAAGRKILEAALKAKGGEAKVRKIHDLVGKGKVKILAGGQNLEGGFDRYLSVDGNLRLDVSLAMGKLSVLVNGQGAWQMFGPQVQRLPADVERGHRASIWRDRDLVFLRVLDKATVVEALPAKTIDGVAYDVVQVRGTAPAQDVTLLLHPKTHLLFRLVFDEEGAPSTEEYSDYRKVDGMPFSFVGKASRQGQMIEATLTEVKVNAGIAADVFASPPGAK